MILAFVSGLPPVLAHRLSTALAITAFVCVVSLRPEAYAANYELV